MPNTPKMGFPYPAFQQKPFWDTWQSLMSALDASIWASLENIALLLEGGGTISLNPTTNILTWTDEFHILDLMTGGMVVVEADSLSGVLDGKIVYVTVSRPVVGTQLLTFSVADTLGNDANKVFVGIRRGTDFILRPQTGLMLPVAPVGEAIFVDRKVSPANGGSVGSVFPCWFPRQLQITEENPISNLVELMSWNIIALSDGGGVGPYTITVAGDQISHFPNNHLLDIHGSTDNDNDSFDERYIILSTIPSSGNTIITVDVPTGLSFDPSTPDGKVYTGRFIFKDGGKYLISGTCMQASSDTMKVRFANVSGNSYLFEGAVNVQAGAVSVESVPIWNTSGGVAIMSIELGMVVSVSTGDIFEVQEYFEGSVGISTALGKGDGGTYARVRIKRAE